jgi:hypothetical protein
MINTLNEQLVRLLVFTHILMFEYFFRNNVDKVQVELKSDKNKGYFTRKPMYIYYNILPNSS